MNNRALLSAVALAFAVAGCDTKAPATTTVTTKPASAPSAPAQVVQNATPDSRTAQKTDGDPTKKCDEKGEKCDVNITVTSCAPDGSGITLDHEVLGVLKNSGEVEIRWTIAGNEYKFDGNNGIAFKPGTNWQQEFNSLSGNANRFKLKDKNHLGTPPGRRYPYTVKILKKDGSACASKDPTIVNDV